MIARYFQYFLMLLAGAAGTAAAQHTAQAAPIKWEQYGIQDHQISLLLPKLPNVVDAGNPCAELDKKSYFTYADEAVYELVVAAKSKVRPPNWCREKKQFGEGLLAARLEELREGKSGNRESRVSKFDRQVMRFENDSAERWVVPDLSNNRWLELAVHRREKGNDQQFLDSLDLGAFRGREIGGGAEATLGDADPASAPTQTEQNAGAPATEVLRIISKPQARYTDAARQTNVQGTVRLKVTLSADGSVGKVTPVSELTHGLTEQAIDAARRLVFLPKRANGVPVTTVVTVEYSFSIF